MHSSQRFVSITFLIFRNYLTRRANQTHNAIVDGSMGIAWFDSKEPALSVFQTTEGQSAGAVAESSKSAIFVAEEVVIVRHSEIRLPERAPCYASPLLSLRTKLATALRPAISAFNWSNRCRASASRSSTNWIAAFFVIGPVTTGVEYSPMVSST